MFWLRYFYFIGKLPFIRNYTIFNFFKQNNQTKFEIGNIYDRSCGKSVRSCPMIEGYFDCCIIYFLFATWLPHNQHWTLTVAIASFFFYNDDIQNIDN